MAIEWSEYQKAIFENVKNIKTGHVFVEACAGSAKTTSLLEALKHIPEGKTCLLAAFNKRIADELKKRAPKSFEGEICTIHSLGLKALGRTFKSSVEPDKTSNIIRELVGTGREKADLRYSLSRAVSMAKNSLALDEQAIDEMLDEYDLDFPQEIFRDIFIKLIIKVMDESKKDTSIVDFDDMVYLPNVLNCKIIRKDFVFIDEFQDINNSQLNLLLKTADEKSRIFMYGDKNQAIYRFRTADPKNIERIRETLNAESLPLSISYRCPVKVIKEAQRLVPHIEAAPNAKEGYLGRLTLKELKERAKPGCFILSRTNAPLIGLALHFLSKGIPANIQGRDLGSNLQSLIKKSKCKKLDKFMDWLDKWGKKEIERLKEKDKDIEPVLDKIECFKALGEGCENVSQLLDNIKELFSDEDDSKKIVCSSVHRAKGLERDVVYLLDWTFKYYNQEEKNIRYVAVTRSKDELYFVSQA
jgi:DNA helicase-2/ATP-dependent DNA helicase PcrA